MQDDLGTADGGVERRAVAEVTLDALVGIRHGSAPHQAAHRSILAAELVDDARADGARGARDEDRGGHGGESLVRQFRGRVDGVVGFSAARRRRPAPSAPPVTTSPAAFVARRYLRASSERATLTNRVDVAAVPASTSTRTVFPSRRLIRPANIARTDFNVGTARLNRALGLILTSEAPVVSRARLPFGVSVLALARR